MKFDFHPTPYHLASLLVENIKSTAPNAVADFSVGEGSLLLAAQERWPRALKIATDIQEGFIGRIRGQFPSWKSGKCDFLNDVSVRSCKALQNREGTVDVILLNPPFSCSPKIRKKLTSGRPPTVALEFLERATKYGAPNSEICVILPASCLHNEKDRTILDRIEAGWSIKIIGHADRKTFAECSARSTIVHMMRRADKLDSQNYENTEHSLELKLIRGGIHMHSIQQSRAANAVPLVHSTNLQFGTIQGDMPLVVANRHLEGPAVLLHRVGRPSPDKVSILGKGVRVALSDCVIAIPALNMKETKFLREAILRNFDLLAGAYVGTGAPFITLSRLRDVLRQIWK